jgi:hypothetical protein
MGREGDDITLSSSHPKDSVNKGQVLEATTLGSPLVTKPTVWLEMTSLFDRCLRDCGSFIKPFLT